MSVRSHEALFESIYANETWGRGEGSGTGSDPVYCRGYVEWLMSNVPPESKVLDLGCGDMRMWEGSEFLLHNWDYVGVDVSQIALDQAKDRYPEVTLRQMSAQDYFSILQLCFWREIDVILLKDVLMHWTDEELERHLTPLCEGFGGTIVTANSWKYWRKPRPAYPRVLDRYSMAPIAPDHPTLVALGFSEAGSYARGKKKIMVRYPSLVQMEP